VRSERRFSLAKRGDPMVRKWFSVGRSGYNGHASLWRKGMWRGLCLLQRQLNCDDLPSSHLLLFMIIHQTNSNQIGSLFYDSLSCSMKSFCSETTLLPCTDSRTLRRNSHVRHQSLDMTETLNNSNSYQ
jgi:hypothetical protein